MKSLIAPLITVIFFICLLWNDSAKKYIQREEIYKNHIDSLQHQLDTLIIVHKDVCEVLNDLPLEKPLQTLEVNDKYGWRRDPFTKRSRFHSGLDFEGTYRDTVYATANGIVEKARWRGGYGRCVVIKHAEDFQTLYGHLSRIFVAVGDSIIVGQAIGRVGSTGRSTGSHLHYEIIHDGKSIDPCNYVPFLENTQCE